MSQRVYHQQLFELKLSAKTFIGYKFEVYL